jgi:NAD(P)H dehydrogenase (quinone)
MADAVVVYYSRSGNTKEMAELISKSIQDSGVNCDCEPVGNVSVDQLVKYDAIVMGSPTYYGHMTAELKQLIDNMVKKHGQFDGKLGAAFSSSANVGGGNETAITGILQSMLVAGFIIEGDPKGDHYGPVSIGKPDERAKKQCARKGKRVAGLAKKLFG